MSAPRDRLDEAGEQWNHVYEADPSGLSWYQRDPAVSARLIRSLVAPDAAVVDVGAGASTLVGVLVAAGYRD